MNKTIKRPVTKKVQKRKYTRAEIERNRSIACVLVIAIAVGIFAYLAYSGWKWTKDNPEEWQQEISQFHQ